MPNVSTSGLGLETLNLRVTLPILTGALYAVGVGDGLYNFIDSVAGAKYFGIVSPHSQPTLTEAAYTNIIGIRNLANAASGLGMTAFSQLSGTYTKLPTGHLVAAAVRKGLDYSMLLASVVTFSDGYNLQQFSDVEGLPNEAANTAKMRCHRYAASSLSIALLGAGCIDA